MGTFRDRLSDRAAELEWRAASPAWVQWEPEPEQPSCGGKLVLARTGFEKVVGHNHAKRELERFLLLPVVCPQLFAGSDEGESCFVLLVGCGMTAFSSLVEAMVKSLAARRELAAKFHYVAVAQALSGGGDVAGLVNAIFDGIEAAGVPFAFVEGMDELWTERRGGEGRIQGALLRRLDRVRRSGFYLFASMKEPWTAREELISRFRVRVEVALPTAPERDVLLSSLLEGCPNEVRPAELEWLVQVSDGCTALDLRRWFSRARTRVWAGVLTATHFVREEDGTLDTATEEEIRSRKPYVVECRFEQLSHEQVRLVRPRPLTSNDLRAVEVPRSASREDVQRMARWASDHIEAVALGEEEE